MKLAYIDTSYLAAIAFDEPGAHGAANRLRAFDLLISSNLLEAELRSVFLREKVDDGDRFLSWVSWVYPQAALTKETIRVLRHGYLRGADLWHLACALHVAGHPDEMHFLTFDRRQSEVAVALGFRV